MVNNKDKKKKFGFFSSVKKKDNLDVGLEEATNAFANSIVRLIKAKDDAEEEVKRLKKNQKEPTTILDDKVNDFIKWYYDNMIKGQFTEYGEFSFPREMRDLIEKMAVWYELRYPEYEVNRIMHCCGEETIDVNDVMFNDNPYVNALPGENSNIKNLDWEDFYNTHVFMKSLPWSERLLFTKPRFNPIVYIDQYDGAHLHLTKNGYVSESYNIDVYTKGIISGDVLEGMHVSKVLKLFKENNIKLPENNGLEAAIKYCENWNYQREGILDCVMYRIIERGGNRIGPRRAFLFAKEFNRNIDIPMKYAVDRTDPGLRLFMNEYLKAGGSKDLVCYVDYFVNPGRKEKINTITVQELILTQNNNAATFYTPEETELHQKIVNAIASAIDHEQFRQEEVKKLRLERKIQKAKTRQ